MADRSASAGTKPIWMKQAEEARIKSEAEKDAAAKAAFEATFKSLEYSKGNPNPSADDDESDNDGGPGPGPSSRPIGPADPSNCLAAGPGIAGGSAGSASTFTVTAKDSEDRKLPTGGDVVTVRVSPGVGVGGGDQEGIVKDQGDGTYAVTYAVPKRGNYMVHVEFNGHPIMGSPFPVFFSAATGVIAPTAMASPVIVSPYPSMMNQTMPNMPNYSGSVSGAFPGLMGMIPGMLPGATGGVALPGVAGPAMGEVCREYLSGRCAKTDCTFRHPPQSMLMAALSSSSTLGTLSQQPMAPSAAAMAAAQAIVAARHAAQMQAQAAELPGSPDKAGKADALKRTLQVSNLCPLLTAEQLKQLFAYCGTVVDCSITDSKNFAYIEYSKPQEASAALALNNLDVGGRPLNVEMAKSLPSKSVNTSVPLMMQQAVALQQMQFQQALLMQQTMASQQAASRAATMKSATEMASARAAEISKKLKAEGFGVDDKEATETNTLPSPLNRKSKSRSRSPIKYRRYRRSHSISPSIRFARDRRSRSPMRSHYSGRGNRRIYRDDWNSYNRGGRRERERSHDRYSLSRRNRSRSASPRSRRSARADSISPKPHRESLSPRTRRSSQAASRSPRHHRGSRSSPKHDHGNTASRSPGHHRGSRSSPKRDHGNAASHRSRHSRSRSEEGRHHSNNKEDTKNSEKIKHNHHSRHSRPRSGEGRHHSNNKEDTQISEKLKHDSDKSDKNNENRSTEDLRESKGDRKENSPVGTHKRISYPDDVSSHISEKLKHDSDKSDKNNENISTEDLRESKGDRKEDSPVGSHKRISYPDDVSTQISEKLKHNSDKSDKNNENRSTEDLRESKGDKKEDSPVGSHKRISYPDDVSSQISEKLKHDSDKSDKNNENRSTEDLRESKGGRKEDSPVGSHKRISYPDDVSTQISEKLKHDSDKSDKNNENRSTEELIESKGDRKEDSPVGSHKRISYPDDVSLENQRDSNHHKKSKVDDRNANQSDAATKVCNSTREDMDSYEDKRTLPFPVSTEHKMGSAHDNGDNRSEHRESSRHERSSSSYKKHEKSEPATKERDSITDKSSHSREDKRPSHRSSSRSHRSSRHLEERSSRDSKDHHRQERSREDYKKTETVDTTVKESRSSGRRHERTTDSSNMAERSSSRSTKDKAVRNADDFRGDAVLKDEKRPSEKFANTAKDVNFADVSLTGEKELDSLNYKFEKYERSPIADDHGACILDRDDCGKHDAHLESEHLGSPTSIEPKIYVSQEFEDVLGDRQVETDMMTKYQDHFEQKSPFLHGDSPQEAADSVKRMESTGDELKMLGKVGEILKRLEPSNENENGVSDADINYTSLSNQVPKVDTDNFTMEDDNVHDVSKLECLLKGPSSIDQGFVDDLPTSLREDSLDARSILADAPKSSVLPSNEDPTD